MADFPIFVLSEIVVMKIKDKAFGNSVRFVINWLLAPFIFIILTAILFSKFIWWQAAIATILLLPAHAVVHDYTRNIRLTISDIKLLCNKKLKSLIKDIRKNF